MRTADPVTGNRRTNRYTHFQHAQPISIAFWMSHYAAVLRRDLNRLKHAYDALDEVRWKDAGSLFAWQWQWHAFPSWSTCSFLLLDILLKLQQKINRLPIGAGFHIKRKYS